MKTQKYWLISLFTLCGVLLTSTSSVKAQLRETQEVKGRFTISLSGGGWHLWQDKQAEWQQDQLFLPEETADLSLLPVNPPTGGWEQLQLQRAKAVHVPGTVEEYLTTSDYPRPEDGVGVSWWFRTLKLPAALKGKRFLIHFESVRLRAEVYLDGKLVAYDIVGESPFTADITDAVQPGKEQCLAVRVTNPGGNFHWQDFNEMYWGKYQIPPGRAFGGIIGRVHLDAVSSVYVSDIYMQNQPERTKVKAILTVNNVSSKLAKQDIHLSVSEKENPGHVILRKKLPRIALKQGVNTVAIELDCPDAKNWDLDSPHLYVCAVDIQAGKKVSDHASQTFGFRWFEPVGIGKDAMLRLNGRRIMLRTAISWGYWPVTGLYATPEMATKQILTAKRMGLNTLNFHRSIGSPVVLEKADELGLLYHEEPGAFHSAGHDPFIRIMVNEKLHRMILRDRSHPSLVVYNLINEFGGPRSKDEELVAKRMEDMKKAHALDPSRVMTFTSGWASKESAEEDSKAHMRPFDSILYRKGWFDNHRAGGPATWEEEYYRGPKDNLMYTDNQTEIYMRGEEGAISTPPRIAEIVKEIDRSGRTGWDGLFWKKQHESFEQFMQSKNLYPYFGSIDSLTRALGDVSFDHQGRRIQGMRMQDVGDAYAINGWEAMPYDNHSGVVDIYRNPKGNLSTLTYYTQPLYVAVSSRAQFACIPGKVGVDFHLVNEKNLTGEHRLLVTVCAPDGKEQRCVEKEVRVSGGDCFGQLLLEDCELDISGTPGMYTIHAQLLDTSGQVRAEGRDEVLGVSWRKEQLAGKGALYAATDDPVATFYQKATGRSLPAFRPDMEKLDWILVTRPSLDMPQPVLPEFFEQPDGKPAFELSFYKDDDLRALAGVTSDNKIDRTFAEGAQPDALLPANQDFSAVWQGKIVVPQTGMYMIGATTDRGVRLSVNNQRIMDEWGNEKEITLTRPFQLKAGEEIEISLEYRQKKASGSVQLVWSRPGDAAIAPQDLLDRVKKDGTSLLLLKSAESWMDAVSEYTGSGYHGYYSVGRNWVGGMHFVKDHPLFNELPVNCAMGWPYQTLVRDGDRRLGFYLDNEELVVGSYRSTPFHLGSAVGIVPCGKGKVYYSTLDLIDSLNDSSGASEVARKLFCNFIEVASKGRNDLWE